MPSTPSRRRDDVIVDVPAQLLERHVGGFGGDEQDRVARNVDAVDLRLEDAVGQVAADLVDRVAHVVDRAVGRRADLELDEGVADCLRGREMLISSTPLTLRIAASTFCVIWFSISVGAAPGCEMFTLAAGKSMSGLLLTSMPRERDEPGQHQADEQHDRRHRVADAPGRDVAEIHRLKLPTRSARGLAARARPSGRG